MYVIGVDIGTTGTKAMLVNEKGEIVSTAYRGYELLKLEKGVVEQRAEDWWETFVYTVRECVSVIEDAHNIRALSVSSQAGSLVPVDAGGEPLANVMVWMDHRAVEQKEELLNLHSNDFYYMKTGWRLVTGLNLVKLKWMRALAPEVFEKAFKYLTTIDFINFRLTGEFAIDPSNGAMTQLMNIEKKEWDGEILDIAGICRDKLPEILPSAVEIGKLSKRAASELGLPESVKIINGGHDQYCAAVGSGAVKDGDILLSTGTAWVVLGITDRPLIDTKTYISPGPHIVKDMWGALASIPTAGVSMEWFRDNFALRMKNDHRYDKESFKDIDEKASGLMKRAQNLFFYPHFNGSGFPRWNDRMKANLLGLGLEHGSYDVARAIMEGMAFEVKYMLEEYRNKGCSVNTLRILGGASRSALWTDIIANVIDCPVIKFDEANIACVGAAIIAGVGSSMFGDYTHAYKKISGFNIYETSGGSQREFYREKFEKYKLGLNFLEQYYNSMSL